jgi:hypothetical protein
LFLLLCCGRTCCCCCCCFCLLCPHVAEACWIFYPMRRNKHFKQNPE